MVNKANILAFGECAFYCKYKDRKCVNDNFKNFRCCKYYTESKLDNGVETNEVGPRSREENRL